MKPYLQAVADFNDPAFVSVIDELPLWSAPFGLKLLEHIRMHSGMKVLDIGSGLGFPLIEISQRLGNTSHVYGIDPWKQGLDRIRTKLSINALTNVTLTEGISEHMPFEDNFFDLIVSNNGINNVQDIWQTFTECARVSKQDAQFVFTMNLDATMKEFYAVMTEVFIRHDAGNSIRKMEEHIYTMRKPENEIKEQLADTGFSSVQIHNDMFALRFTDGTAMLNHCFIKYWFLPHWKELITPEMQETIFDEIEEKLNTVAKKQGTLELSIPFATFVCEKK